jgi:helicase
MIDSSLNPAQQAVIDHGLLDTGFSCVLQMPTGSGKTWLAARAMEGAIGRGFRAVYLAPLRALAEELLVTWQQRFGREHVGIFTGDYTRDGRKPPVAYDAARLMIMTPERLDACTRNWRSHWSWMPEVDLVVVDELHQLGDSGRGARLEGTLTRMRRLNPFCRFLGLSATLGNRGELADWWEGVEYQSDWRPVSLSWKIARYRKADEKPELLAREVEPVVRSGGQSIVFVQSRRRSEHLARSLTERGIAAQFHHAGLQHGVRRTTEEAFRKRQVSVLVATGTLEMGLNLPARQVVLFDLQGFDGEGFVPLSTNTVWQRAGRAGRPGLDSTGEVVLLAPAWDREVQRYADGKFERVRSGLSCPAALAEQILVEVQGGFSRSEAQLDRAMSKTLFAFQNKGLDVRRSVEEMTEAGMLEAELEEGDLPGEERLHATPLGRLCVRHLLRPDTVLRINRFLRAHPTRSALDILIVAAGTEDCEPRISVDFEELDQLGEALSGWDSQVLGRCSRALHQTLGIRGRQLLSAIKTAALLLRWTELGDVDSVAGEMGCYPFELLRLHESMDRLLQACCAIQRMIDGRVGEQAEDLPKSAHLNELETLQQMIRCGLPEEAAGLTKITGIGTQWARKLVSAGVANLADLSAKTPSELHALGGVSEERALRWIQEARERNSLCVVKNPTRTTAIQVRRTEWSGNVDPYRLRRSLELTVARTAVNRWLVSGGLEPHYVLSQESGWVCDCLDHAKGNHCKHLIAVRRFQGDQEVLEAISQLQSSSDPSDPLNLMGLWFERDTPIA